MEKTKIDIYLISNAKYFEASALPIIRQRLENLNDNDFLRIQAFELKDPLISLLFSIFFGTIGLDRFFVGDIGMGLLKLLTGGLCGILTIFDWFTIIGRTKKLNFTNLSMLL